MSRANNATTEKEHAITTTTTRTGYGRQRAGIGLTERMKACRTCSTSWGTYGPVAAYPFDGTRDLTPQTLKPSYSSLPVGGTPFTKFISPPRHTTRCRGKHLEVKVNTSWTGNEYESSRAPTRRPRADTQEPATQEPVARRWDLSAQGRF